jgi:hypothetical protein
MFLTQEKQGLIFASTLCGWLCTKESKSKLMNRITPITIDKLEYLETLPKIRIYRSKEGSIFESISG